MRFLQRAALPDGLGGSNAEWLVVESDSACYWIFRFDHLDRHDPSIRWIVANSVFKRENGIVTTHAQDVRREGYEVFSSLDAAWHVWHELLNVPLDYMKRVGALTERNHHG